jgi:hypothetical protein
MSNRVSRNRFPLAQILAVAAIAAVGSAHAQSSVQAYGLVDMSAGKFQSAGAVSDKSVQSGNMSTSYIGFGRPSSRLRAFCAQTVAVLAASPAMPSGLVLPTRAWWATSVP